MFQLKAMMCLLPIILSSGHALFFQHLKKIWNSGGFGVTFISNPYDFSDHYNVCIETCSMSVSCWISGGVKVSGNCESIFHVCCKLFDRPVAEARKINNWDDIITNNLEEPEDLPLHDVYYGPVVNEPNCGQRTVAKRRVVGGTNAGFGSYPWQAMIRIRDSRCGGALIGRRHVVTAGHCVKIHLSDSIDESPIRGVNVYLGEYSLYNSKEPLPRQRFSVDKIYVHPYYEFTPQADRYDIAVLKLSRPVRYDWHIGPICLPERGSDISVGSSAMVAGWGATEPDSIRRPKELQAVDVNVVDNKQCEKWHAKKGINIRIYDDMLCAGHEHGGKDACQGDSGGPLMTKLNQSSYDDLTHSSKRRWTLVGLVSAGYSCAKPGQPGIYHRLSKSSDWISYVRMASIKRHSSIFRHQSTSRSFNGKHHDKGKESDPICQLKWPHSTSMPNMESKKNCSLWIPNHLILLSCYLVLSTIVSVEGTYVKSSSISSISRSTVSCRQAGGFCEPMFGCLLNHGVVQGSCHGFLTVCCAQPTSSQHVSFEGEENAFSVKNRVIESTQTSLSTSASSFSPSIIFPSNAGALSSTEHQSQPTSQINSNSIASSGHSGRAFPQNRWINQNWVQTENSHSDVQKPDFPESLSKRTGTNVERGFYPYSSKRNFRRLLIDYGPVVNDPQCGRPVSANRRVLDGQPAGFGSFPWQALIRVGKGKCGGVLVNRRHVVTAGHCVKNKLLRSVIVTLGEYHLRSRREPLPTQEFRVVKAYVHPKFQFSPAADRYDVAVLRLARPVRYAPHIAPICLPEAGRDPAAGTHAYVAGWGALIPDDVTGPLIPLLVPEVKRPSVLQVVNVPVQTNERCEKWHRDAGIKVTIWPEMVCAGYRLGGKDSCKGDSGGPLMVQQADGRWVLIGLVSAGFSCGKPGQPGIYHRISATSDWISFYINGRDRRRALYH